MNRRILRVITRLNIGGPASHAILADGGLTDLGWETLLVHGRVEPDETEIDLATATTPRRLVRTLARPIHPLDDARAMAAIVGIIRAYRPAIIHTHLSKAGLLGRAAAIASSGAIRVHTFHGTVFADYFGRRSSRAIIAVERILGRGTHAILALSERQRSELLAERICRPEQVRIVPLGLDLDRFGRIDRATARRSLGVGDGPVVVSIGRLVAIKRIDRLIRSFAEASLHVPAARLVLVGDGAERSSLERLAAGLGLADRVCFAGWSNDASRWYAAADVVALSSDREGTPLSLIEAAAAGRPVVATDVGGVADVVVDGVTGFIVAREDERAFAARLTELLGGGPLRERMGAEAPPHASGWSAARLVTNLDTTYRALLGRRG